MKQAIIYVRVSTDQQVQGMSLDNQLLACQQWAAHHEIAVHQVFRDEGKSAKTLDRPEMKRMLKYIEENKKVLNYLVTYQTDRLTRNVADFFFLRGHLAKYGIEYKNCNSKLEEDAGEKFMTGIQALFGEYDNSLKSERVRANMAKGANEGYRMHKAPYGLKNARDITGKPIVVEDEQLSGVLKIVIEKFSEGLMNIKETLEFANNLGLRRADGSLMSFQLLGKILRNPLYAGYELNSLTSGKMIKSNFDGIVTLNTYLTNQKLLVAHKNSKIMGYTVNNPLFPLRRFLKCSSCDMPLRGSSPKGGSGKIYPKYHCSTKKCSQPSISHDDLHEKFKTMLKEVQLSEGSKRLFKVIMQRIWNEDAKSYRAKRDNIEKKIREIESSKTKVFDKLIQEVISQQEKLDYFQRADQELIGLNSALQQLSRSNESSSAVIDFGIEYIANISESWSESDLSTKILIQEQLFPGGLFYDAKMGIFRTDKISALYRLVSIKKDPSVEDESLLVIPRRIELRLPG